MIYKCHQCKNVIENLNKVKRCKICQELIEEKCITAHLDDHKGKDIIECVFNEVEVVLK